MIRVITWTITVLKIINSDVNDDDGGGKQAIPHNQSTASERVIASPPPQQKKRKRADQRGSKEGDAQGDCARKGGGVYAACRTG